jgi:hypothetical protein
MALPVSRNYTLAALSKVLSTLLNTLQDAIVSIFGPRKTLLGPGDMTIIAGALNAAKVTVGAGGSPATLWIELPLEVGQRLVDATAWINQTNAPAARATLTIIKFDSVGTQTTIAGPTNAPAGTGWTSIAIAGINYVVAAHERVIAQIVLQHDADQWVSVEINRDRTTL